MFYFKFSLGAGSVYQLLFSHGDNISLICAVIMKEYWHTVNRSLYAMQTSFTLSFI